jgi:phosphoglycerate kinase
VISYDKFHRQLYKIFSQDPEINAIPLEEILDSIPTLDQLHNIPKGTTVLLRAELDVPLEKGEVADFSRIETNLQTLRYCLSRGWKTVIIGHIGRDKHLSVRPVCEAISKEIGQRIEFISDWLDEADMKLIDEAASKIASAPSDTIFMLENTRRYDIERELWRATEDEFPSICQRMYAIASDIRQRLAEIEINEAIAASNFDFSSSILPLAMSKTALGFFISEEMKTHVKAARRSNMIVISGLKIDKLDDLEANLERGNTKLVIAAGSLAMALIKAQAQLAGGDFSIGRAEADPHAKFYIAPDRIEQGKRIIQRCRKDGVELVLPNDFVLDNGKDAEEIPRDRAQFDIGPKTRELISKKVSEYISKSKQSPEPFAVYFNGVFGKFEDPRYEAGTREFILHLRAMTQAGILTYVGGGEGRLALLKYGAISDVTHAFTAGGTILKSLSDRHIQFLKAMYLQNKDLGDEGEIVKDRRVEMDKVALMVEESQKTADLTEIDTNLDRRTCQHCGGPLQKKLVEDKPRRRHTYIIACKKCFKEYGGEWIEGHPVLDVVHK